MVQLEWGLSERNNKTTYTTTTTTSRKKDKWVFIDMYKYYVLQKVSNRVREWKKEKEKKKRALSLGGLWVGWQT